MPAKTGACVSTTTIVCEAVVEFAQLTIAVHLLTKVELSGHAPGIVVCANVIVTIASQLSVAVGVAGGGTALHCTVTFAGMPAKTGACVSTTTIVCEAVVEFAQLSVAVHVLTKV